MTYLFCRRTNYIKRYHPESRKCRRCRSKCKDWRDYGKAKGEHESPVPQVPEMVYGGGVLHRPGDVLEILPSMPDIR